ncbi:MAG: hypothetical protein IPO92_24285 [Saprospiraceae bacterium]|nr:hypothetical protein [Saprospiraceae bacterium]
MKIITTAALLYFSIINIGQSQKSYENYFGSIGFTTGLNVPLGNIVAETEDHQNPGSAIQGRYLDLRVNLNLKNDFILTTSLYLDFLKPNHIEEKLPYRIENYALTYWNYYYSGKFMLGLMKKVYIRPNLKRSYFLPQFNIGYGFNTVPYDGLKYTNVTDSNKQFITHSHGKLGLTLMAGCGYMYHISRHIGVKIELNYLVSNFSDRTFRLYGFGYRGNPPEDIKDHPFFKEQIIHTGIVNRLNFGLGFYCFIGNGKG